MVSAWSVRQAKPGTRDSVRDGAPSGSPSPSEGEGRGGGDAWTRPSGPQLSERAPILTLPPRGEGTIGVGRFGRDFWSSAWRCGEPAYEIAAPRALLAP